MHKDMHYAGTYALAKLAGLSDDTALKIGGSAQFVDDSGDDESIYDDKTGELFASEISTRYADIAKYAKQRSFLLNYIDQLAIWVPFHFLPGGKGNTLTQKLVCQPDSEIARAMIASHLKKAVALQEGGRKWGPHLIGVAAHVYADTFAHYGFSGVSSRRNLVKAHTIREVGGNAVEWQKKVKKFRKNWGYTFGNISTFFDAGSQSKEVGNDDAGMWQKFWKKSGYIYSNAKNSLLGLFGEISTLTKDGAMGHPGVASMPDLPYLRYSFEYEREDLLFGDAPDKPRDNPATYLLACEKMHDYFADYLAKSGEEMDAKTRRNFNDVREDIRDILSYRDDDKEKRLQHWRKQARQKWGIEIPEYPGDKWKERFRGSQNRDDVLTSDAYRFYMAAAWHKKTILNEVLPQHGINIECRQFRIEGGFAS